MVANELGFCNHEQLFHVNSIPESTIPEFTLLEI
jgi:hypothetical protein